MNYCDRNQPERPAVGTFAHLGGGTAMECLALAGFDYVIADAEHGPFSVESMQEMVRALQIHGCKAFVRASASDRPSLMRMLDIGADALIIPNVQSVEETQKIVEYTKFFPMGRRGFAFSRCCGYGQDRDLQSLDEYFAKANSEKWIIPQCETLGALEDIEKIVALEGVDGIFLGPYDLSSALGAPARFDTDKFRKSVERVIRACKDRGKISMIFAASTAQAKAYWEQGFDMVAIGTDTDFLISRCQKVISELVKLIEED